MSILLLLARTCSGKGPKIPIRDNFGHVVVEGLIGGDRLNVHYPKGPVTLFENGRWPLPHVIEKGSIVQAELVGENSCVHVRLEN